MKQLYYINNSSLEEFRKRLNYEIYNKPKGKTISKIAEEIYYELNVRHKAEE